MIDLLYPNSEEKLTFVVVLFRFATYRTAAKIRYVQRKGYLHHIDIWNVIEAFRENGLNTMEATTLVNRPRLETLLSSLYTSLNKRLPPGQNISVEKVGDLWGIFSEDLSFVFFGLLKPVPVPLLVVLVLNKFNRERYVAKNEKFYVFFIIFIFTFVTTYRKKTVFYFLCCIDFCNFVLVDITEKE